jgi:hypothetical protein
MSVLKRPERGETNPGMVYPGMVYPPHAGATRQSEGVCARSDERRTSAPSSVRTNGLGRALSGASAFFRIGGTATPL